MEIKALDKASCLELKANPLQVQFAKDLDSGIPLSITCELRENLNLVCSETLLEESLHMKKR